MARTYRLDRWTQKKVPDKDVSWKCRCAYCRSLDFHKALESIHQQEVSKAMSSFPYNHFTKSE